MVSSDNCSWTPLCTPLSYSSWPQTGSTTPRLQWLFIRTWLSSNGSEHPLLLLPTTSIWVFPKNPHGERIPPTTSPYNPPGPQQQQKTQTHKREGNNKLLETAASKMKPWWQMLRKGEKLSNRTILSCPMSEDNKLKKNTYQSPVKITA